MEVISCTLGMDPSTTITTAKEPRMIYSKLVGIAMGATFFHGLITITEVLHRSSGRLLLLRCSWQKQSP
jgi:hypothetical protein